jgi:predicted nuclease of predicted toxin-antitoxin system
MRFLADENIDSALVTWLRAQRHDVVHVAEVLPSSTDPRVLRLAEEEHRILITGDVNFASMIFRTHACPAGIILLRIHADTQRERLEVFAAMWPAVRDRVDRAFTVIGNTRVRIRRLAPDGDVGEGDGR